MTRRNDQLVRRQQGPPRSIEQQDRLTPTRSGVAWPTGSAGNRSRWCIITSGPDYTAGASPARRSRMVNGSVVHLHQTSRCTRSRARPRADRRRDKRLPDVANLGSP
jgi:hypothetical protein